MKTINDSLCRLLSLEDGIRMHFIYFHYDQSSVMIRQKIVEQRSSASSRREREIELLGMSAMKNQRFHGLV